MYHVLQQTYRTSVGLTVGEMSRKRFDTEKTKVILVIAVTSTAVRAERIAATKGIRIRCVML